MAKIIWKNVGNNETPSCKKNLRKQLELKLVFINLVSYKSSFQSNDVKEKIEYQLQQAVKCEDPITRQTTLKTREVTQFYRRWLIYFCFVRFSRFCFSFCFYSFKSRFLSFFHFCSSSSFFVSCVRSFF